MIPRRSQDSTRIPRTATPDSGDVHSSPARETRSSARKSHPIAILGGDAFLDYWGPQRTPELSTMEGVYAIMEKAYLLGVRGYDVSLNDHVIEAVRKLKGKYADVTIYGNPNWRGGVMLGNATLHDLKTTLVRTIYSRRFTPEQRSEVNQMAEDRRRRWALSGESQQTLSETDVANITLDDAAFVSNLKKMEGTADYGLVGTDYADWLIPLGRSDVLHRMIELTRRQGLRPLSISHWASITLPQLDVMDVEGHWIYLNKSEQLFSRESALAAIRDVQKPVTAFRVLGGGTLSADLSGALTFIRQQGIRSIVIGAINAAHLEATIPVIDAVWSKR